jgi:DNA-binding transcriptional LysR family regulator
MLICRVQAGRIVPRSLPVMGLPRRHFAPRVNQSRNQCKPTLTVSIHELLDEPIVAAPGCGIWRDYWLACAYREERLPNVAHEAPTFESEFQAVASGKGISITPIAARRFYARPRLAFPRIEDTPLCRVSVALPNPASALARELTQVAVALAQRG